MRGRRLTTRSVTENSVEISSRFIGDIRVECHSLNLLLPERGSLDMYTIEELLKMLQDWEKQAVEQGNYVDSRLLSKIANLKKELEVSS